jgi:UDP-N-acetylmuramoyl-tripeptide--D-alanyl-D-alanine ligase
MCRLEDIITAVKGTVLKKNRDLFTGISTDSRTIGEGELFIPIVGKSFDGHSFIEQALKASRGGALCRNDYPVSLADVPGTVILVEDTNQALLDIARFKRESIPGKFICITGSNGKTTTKEILAGMLKKKFDVHYNEKNLNNLIGVPLAILAITGEPEACILELGTNMPGEIRKLAFATDPDISLITNVNPSHLEGLETLDGILEEKLDLFRYTRPHGKIIVNIDDPGIAAHYRHSGHTAVTFGIENDAYYHLRVIRDLGWEGSVISIISPAGTIEARTSLLGRHNHYNLLAAATAASIMGVDHSLIAGAIEEFTSYDKRLKPIESSRGFIIIDDTYNANPASMEWAIRTLSGLPSKGKKAVVLGGMKELGRDSAFYHGEMGKFLKNVYDVELIALFGEETADTFAELANGRAVHFTDKTKLLEFLNSHLNSGDTVLVKGSRAFKMEEIVEALK